MKKILKKKSSTNSQTQINLSNRQSTITNNTTSSSPKQIIIILCIFLTTIVIIGTFLGYNMHVNLQKANDKLQKIQLKFHKFLFYLKYIYKNQKHKEELNAQQNNSILNLLTKFGNNQHKKQLIITQQNNKRKITPKSDSLLNNQPHTKINTRNQQISSRRDNDQLLSNQQILDIARQIIEQDNQHQQQKRIHQQIIAQEQKLEIAKDKLSNQNNNNSSILQSQLVQNYVCQMSQQNIFYPNFQFDPSTQKLRKSIYTSDFQSIICQQPIPKKGTHQLSIKIIQTTKSFIYIGIAGGNKTQIYNLTSLHQNANFYGYSGYSGRIWQATKRKVPYEMFQTNSILKLQVDMSTNIISYFFNDYKIGDSNFDNLCQNQCYFVIQMYNDSDQIQFLQHLQINLYDSVNKLQTDL